MTILYNNKNNTVLFESKAGNALWIPKPLERYDELKSYISSDISAVFCTLTDANYSDLEFLKMWHLVVDPLLAQGTLVVNSAIDARVKDLYVKGINDNGVIHFVITTSECTTMLVNGKISEQTVRKYSPIDVLVGDSEMVAQSQLDFDPFYVLLMNISEEYSKKTGITEIKATDKVSIKKIDSQSREGTIEMQVISLS